MATAAQANGEMQSGAEPIAFNPGVRRQERFLLHALLQATDQGILVTDLDRQDIIANRRLGELFAVSPHEVVQRTPDTVRTLALSRVRHPKAFERRLNEIYADPCVTAEDEIELEGRPTRTLYRHTCPILDQDGRPIARLWTFDDITETRRLQAEIEAQLAARTADFHATSDVLEAMNALCRLATQQGNLDDLIRAMASQLLPMLSFDAVALLIRRRGKYSGVAHRAEGSFRVIPPHPVNEPFTDLDCADTATLPLQVGSKRVGLVIFGRSDAMAALEEDRRSHLQAVADQIALTIQSFQLQNDLRVAAEKLRVTQRRMVEVERLSTAATVASSIAHDIRNILTPLEVDLATGDSSSLKPHLRRFRTLTNQLLAVGKTRVLERVPVALREVVISAFRLVDGPASLVGVVIECRVPEDLPPLFADRSQLEMLFLNLCLNAVQAMSQGGGKLEVDARVDGDYIDAQVTDTGPGIPPDLMPKLFQPFVTTRSNGMGLGLFSCKRIVEEHGGRISVCSAASGGACFRIRLPSVEP